MIEKICNYLTMKMMKKMPEIDDERAEVINYGLQIIIGEIPKLITIFLVAYILGIFKLTILSIIIVTPYKMFSGGVHLKTHIGCAIATSISYMGPALLSKIIVLNQIEKYVVILTLWIFSMIMIKFYAPADTEEVPILRKKDRKFKKIMSYITMNLTLIVSLFINNPIISNLIIFSVLIQTMSITRIIYKITNCKYGYEEYCKKEIIQSNA